MPGTLDDVLSDDKSVKSWNEVLNLKVELAELVMTHEAHETAGDGEWGARVGRHGDCMSQRPGIGRTSGINKGDVR